MCRESVQVNFQFGSGRISFGRVMPFDLKKILIILGFRSLSPSHMDILNRNTSWKYAGRVRVFALIIFGRIMTLGLRTSPTILGFRSLSPSQIDILNCSFNFEILNFVYSCFLKILRSSFEIRFARIILDSYAKKIKYLMLPFVISVIHGHFQL